MNKPLQSPLSFRRLASVGAVLVFAGIVGTPGPARADVCSDAMPPTISITSPEDQATFEATSADGATVSVGIITGDAQDSCACGVTEAWLEVGGTAGTHVNIDGYPVAPNTATASIDATLAVGMHSIVAVALDCEGNEGRSEAIQIAVFEGGESTGADSADDSNAEAGEGDGADAGTSEPKGCSIGNGARPTIAFAIAILGALSLRRRRE